MLILNYLGQGAWLLTNHNKPGFSVVNPFFGIMEEWMIIPGVILATAAAIIASQALITGSFTIFSEAMSLNLWPNQKIDYP
ncbi:KUP/HAK/KT family potassium transporter, partial [Meridianimarinicoccus marinus]